MKHLLIAILCLIVILAVFSINYILGVVSIFVCAPIIGNHLDTLTNSEKDE